jgi:hypothetical protein
MKRILSISLVLALALMVLVPMTAVWGAEDSVTCTVTGENVSVSVTDGEVTYGTLGVDAVKNTLSGGLDDLQTATNDGNVTADFNIKCSNAIDGDSGTDWTLDSTTGQDQFTHEFSTDATFPGTALTGTYQTLATGITASGTETFDLQITMPSSITDYSVKTITVTVQAVAQ